MTMIEQPATYNRLLDLERLVTLLNGQLQAFKQELDQAGARSSAHQSWLIWHNRPRNQLFMSAICNRRIRPNLRRQEHAASPAPR
ncbi:MAG: hypothetical protein NNA22_04195 [Nitrospira sp.]|nr:hypothetical protein [Nitrospira sp.]